MRIAVVVMAGAMVLAACQDRPSAAPPSEPHPSAALSPAPSSRAPQATCATRADGLKRWMSAVAAERVGAKLSDKGSLVVVEEPTLDDTVEGPTLSLAGSKALFDGTPVADLSSPAAVAGQLGSARAARIALWRQTHPGADATRLESEPLHVQLAPGDVWSDVALALNAAREAGYGQMTFTFELATKVAPPPETGISRAYRKYEADTASREPPAMLRARREVPAIATIAARCPQVEESLRTMAERAMGPTEMRAEFCQRVPTAIEACGCAVDPDEVEAWWWFFNDRYEGIPVASYSVAVARPGDPGAGAVAAAARDTWSSVSRAFVAAAKERRAVSFAVR